MNVLLTGYAGLLGRHIARALKRRGWKVRVVLHSRTVTRRLFAAEADELLWGSLEDPALMERAVRGMDAVVHSAWKFSAQGAARPTMNETITLALHRAAAAAGVTKFQFISSVAVYGMDPRGGAALTETVQLSPEGDGFVYPAEKVAVETALLASAAPGMTLSIIRPGPIFDDEKGPVKKVLGLPGVRLGIGFGTGRNPMPYIHAADVAAASVLALGTAPHGAVFNVTPDAALPHKEWYRAWGRHRRTPLTPFFLRAWFMRLAAHGATLLKRALGKQGKVDVEYALAAATRGLRYANTRAKQELGWTPASTEKFLGG